MIRKRSKYYAFEFMESHKRYFGTFNGRDGFSLATSKQHARELENQIRLQVRAGTYGKEEQKEEAEEGFSAFFDKVYMGYSKQHKLSWKHDEFRGEVLKRFFAEKQFPQITPMLVVQFINARLASSTKRSQTRSPVTVHKEVRLLSSVFVMAIGEGLASANPCLSIPKSVKRKLPARNKRDRFLSSEEEERLFAQLRGRRAHVWAIVRLALETGLRKSELYRLEVQHVNTSDDVRFVVVDGKRVEVKPGELLVARGKNGKPRTVPLSAQARAIAIAQMNDVTTSHYLFTSKRTKGMFTDVKTAFCAAVRDAEISDFRFHDLRHTFATRLNDAGVDAFTIRDLLGHATTVMSGDYTHSSPEGRRAAIERMNAQSSFHALPDSVKITASAC